MDLRTNDLFHRSDSKLEDRKVYPAIAAVESVAVYTKTAIRGEPKHYWLTPKTLCVVVDGVSVYVTLKGE